MDEADRAEQIEQGHREAALKHQRERSHEDEGTPFIVDGYRACIDCHAPIPVARLKAVPRALRCVACQEKHERGHHGA